MCGKKDLEVAQGIDHKPQVLQVEKEALRVTASQVETKADLSTPLLMHFALQRRGICLRPMQFDRLEHIHRLIYAMSAPVPPGFCPVTVTQIVRADKELFHDHGEGISSTFQGPCGWKQAS